MYPPRVSRNPQPNQSHKQLAMASVRLGVYVATVPETNNLTVGTTEPTFSAAPRSPTTSAIPEVPPGYTKHRSGQNDSCGIWVFFWLCRKRRCGPFRDHIHYVALNSICLSVPTQPHTGVASFLWSCKHCGSIQNIKPANQNAPITATHYRK